MLFEPYFVRPEEEKISGGKDAKTDWLLKLSNIINKMKNDNYSVPVEDYNYVTSIHEWFMNTLIT